MVRLAVSATIALSWACGIAAETLFVSHYSGQIYTLALTKSSSGAYSLASTSQITGCGGLPEWLTYEPTSKMLYCSDETMYGQASISSFQAGANYALTQTGKANTPVGGVANVLFGGADKRSYIAIAHYQASTVTTFKLPLTSSSQPQQTFKFTMSGPGPNAARQDAPHPHHVVVDPTGAFLLSPDLGADQIRIWSINNSTGMLTTCPSLTVSGGTGPRHATFWKPSDGSSTTMMFVANELANTVSAFKATYPSTASGCISFAQQQSLSPFLNNQAAPSGTKVAEVHIKGSFLYNTNRVDKTFSGNDSVATWSLSSTGTMSFQGLTDSYGTYPRTFSINAAGDLLAVGDQTTANVAILKRDVNSGALGPLVANMRIGVAGTPENEDGLSSVVFVD